MRCKDRTCGAVDCPDCFPGNEAQLAEEQAFDEYMEMQGDINRDMESFEEGGDIES